MNKKNITVLGFGSWGYALSIILNDNGHNVKVWEFDNNRVEKLSKSREFDLIKGTRIPDNILLTNDIASACENHEIIIFAVPSNVIRNVAKSLKDKKIIPKIIVSVAKGIEYSTLFNMSEVIADEFGWNEQNENIYALSGPTHAEEVSNRIFTTVVIAGKNEPVLKELQRVFSNDYFRAYISKDIKGVELGGAVKNVIAIATGIADGLGLGDNTKAALITRGLAEISRLGKIIGANIETFYGLSGLGDLVVTCISKHSRNRYFGEQLGKGKSLDQIQKEMTMVAEGVYATQSIHKLAVKFGIDMPIVKEVYEIIYNGKSPKNAVVDLMGRELKEEKIF